MPRSNVRADYVYTALYDGAVSIDTNWTATADGKYVRRDSGMRPSGSSANESLTGQKGELTYNGLQTRAEFVPSADLRLDFRTPCRNPGDGRQHPVHHRQHQPVRLERDYRPTTTTGSTTWSSTPRT